MKNSQEFKGRLYTLTEDIKAFFREKSNKISSETLNWIAILCLHGATVPGLLAMMTGLSDNPPPVDVVLMVWTGLVLFFTKAAIQRDLLTMITIGFGFVLQAIMMMLIFFK
jgi:hypothetical protein